jgi:hypothetical protein
MTVARVVDSYHGEPCEALRPTDAPTRPGEPCGEIHEHCRGHVRTKSSPRYGDPCGKSAEPGITTCISHGAQLPESAAIVKRERAHRLYGRLVGHESAPVDDPVGELSRILGAMRDWSDGLAELVAEIQEREGDAFTVPAGEAFETVDAQGRHPQITGDLLVLDPAGHYKIHPIVTEAVAALKTYQSALADAVKLGIEERQVTLAEQQLDATVAVVGLVFERLGMDRNDALGMVAAAARDLQVVDTTVAQTVQGHVRRTLGP